MNSDKFLRAGYVGDPKYACPWPK